MTDLPKRYGESTGKLCLSVVSASQPEIIRHRAIDNGIGQARNLQCTAHYLME